MKMTRQPFPFLGQMFEQVRKSVDIRYLKRRLAKLLVCSSTQSMKFCYM